MRRACGHVLPGVRAGRRFLRVASRRCAWRPASGRDGPRWQPGHQYAVRLASPSPRERIARRSAGTAARPAVDGPHAVSRRRRTRSSAPAPSRASSRAPRATPRRPSHGDTRACQSASAAQMFPIPAMTRWSSRTSPSSRAGSARPERAATEIAGRPTPSPSTSGPTAAPDAGFELEHRPVPLDRLPAAARRTSHGRPRPRAPAGWTRQRPLMRRWLRTVETALEAQQEVLAHRVDGFEQLPVDRAARPR